MGKRICRQDGYGLNSEQLVMRSCMGERKDQLLLVLLPDHKPIGLQMAFPKAFVLAVQLVRIVLGRQHPLLLQYLGCGFEDFYIAASLHTSL